MLRRLSTVGLALATLVGPHASAHFLNAYAVSSQGGCGLADLPGTTAELQKLFSSANFPGDLQKNFFWTDGRVRPDEWSAAHDYFESAATVSGYDGADSGLISYLATHGGTSGGHYEAAAGGAAGCSIRSTDMVLGSDKARYLVLSTCESLKIGSGDNPTVPGENPIVTWSRAGSGLNCIFGYSNSMEDADTYGEYLLENLATTDQGLVEAFFNASRRVSAANIPAVLCFGADDASARDHLATAKRFTDEKYGHGGAVYRYDAAHPLDGAFAPPKAVPLPRVVNARSRHLKPAALAAALLGSAATDASPGPELRVYRSALATLTYDERTAVLAWQRDRRGSDLTRATQLKDATVVRVARDFLAAKGVVRDPAAELGAAYVVDQATSSGSKPVVFSKLVVFHQRLGGGLLTLGAAGSVEVAVNADGEVTGVTAALLDVTRPRLVDFADGATLDLAAAKALALKHLQLRLPDAVLAVIEARVGYDAGDRAAPAAKARLVAEILMAAEQGGFTRRYTEKVPL